MVGNILVLKGQSKYNVLRLAADEVAEGFADLGFDVTIADLCGSIKPNDVINTALLINMT